MASDVGKQNLVLLVPLILICAGVLAWMYWPKPRRADADQLAQQALTGENQIVQVQAAVRLRAQGYTPQLREVMAQSRDVDVRATAVQALGDLQDFVSVPELLRLCDDPSPLVRGRAGAALCNILGADFPFQADMPAAERSKVIEAMQRMYEKMRRHPPDKYRSQIP